MWATILSLGTGYSGQMEKAEEWAELAYKSDPQFFPPLILLAWVRGSRGETAAAQASLNEAARLYPKLDAEYIAGFIGGEIVRQLQEAGLTISGS